VPVGDFGNDAHIVVMKRIDISSFLLQDLSSSRSAPGS